MPSSWHPSSVHGSEDLVQSTRSAWSPFPSAFVVKLQPELSGAGRMRVASITPSPGRAKTPSAPLTSVMLLKDCAPLARVSSRTRSLALGPTSVIVNGLLSTVGPPAAVAESVYV